MRNTRRHTAEIIPIIISALEILIGVFIHAQSPFKIGVKRQFILGLEMDFKKQIKQSDTTVPLHALYRGMETAISLLDKYGDAYWPVFERLETQINERESRAERLKKFRQLAANFDEKQS